MEGEIISTKALVILTGRIASRYALLLIAFLLLAFILDNLVFGPLVGGLLGNFLLPSLLWGLLIVFVLSLPGVRPAGKLRLQKLLRWLAMICVLIAVLAVLVQGFMGGFGKSPYDRSLIGVIINFTSLGAILVATELSRSWLVNRFFHQRPLFGISLIAGLFTILSFPIARLAALDGAPAVTEFAGTALFPTLGENLLATYFAFLGGPVPAIIYQGGLLAFERLSPLLPAGGWAAQFLLGMAAPILGLILLHEVYLQESRSATPSRREESHLSWLFTGVAAILIVWFSLGVFSIFPRVIISGSMVPAIDIGDVVIVKKTAGEQVQLGEVILFPLEEMPTVHRVIEVRRIDDGPPVFVTKGDANDSPDPDPVPADHVLGEVIMVVPKVGWITVMLRGG